MSLLFGGFCYLKVSVIWRFTKLKINAFLLETYDNNVVDFLRIFLETIDSKPTRLRTVGDSQLFRIHGCQQDFRSCLKTSQNPQPISELHFGCQIK